MERPDGWGVLERRDELLRGEVGAVFDLLDFGEEERRQQKIAFVFYLSSFASLISSSPTHAPSNCPRSWGIKTLGKSHRVLDARVGLLNDCCGSVSIIDVSGDA